MPLPEVFRKRIKPYEPFIEESANRHGIPSELIRSVIFQESRGNPKAVSKVGARGLTQLMPGTAKEVGIEDPFDPQQAIEGGARYLKKQLDRFGDVTLALAAYNAGPGNVLKHKGVPPFKETRNYVKDVLGRFTGQEIGIPTKDIEINFPNVSKETGFPLREGKPKFRTGVNFLTESLDTTQDDLLKISQGLKKTLEDGKDQLPRDFSPLNSALENINKDLRKSLDEGADFSNIPTGFSVFEEPPSLVQSLLSPLNTLRKGANIGSAKILQNLTNIGESVFDPILQQATRFQRPELAKQLNPITQLKKVSDPFLQGAIQESPTTFERQFREPILQTSGGTTIIPSAGELVRTTGEFAPEAAFAASAPAKKLGQLTVERFGIQTPSIARTTQQAVQAGFGGAAGGLARGEPEQAAIGAVAGPLLTFAGAGLGQTAKEIGKGIKKELPGLAKEAQRLARSEAGSLRLREVTPVPETLQTLNLQMNALRSGRTKALLVTPGSTAPRIPAGFQSLKTPRGTFIFNPKIVSPQEITERVGKGTFGELLGFVEPKSEQTTRAVVALQNGVEAKTALVSPKNVQKQIQEFKRQFPGAEIRVGGEDIAQNVIERRALAPQVDPTRVSIQNQPAELSTESLNFKLEKLDIPPEAKQEILNVADQAEQTIFKQRRGVVDWGTTEKQARELLGNDAFTNKVLNAQPGQAFNASELEALGQANASLATKVSNARNTWLQNPLDTKTQNEFKDLLKLQFKFQKAFQGGVAEAGRGLNILRKTKTPSDTIDALRNKVIDSLNDEQMEQLAVKMAQAGEDPQKQFNVLSEFLESTWVDKIVEFSTAVKLYNPTTHIVNTTSNFMSTMLNTAERFGASGVNFVESAIRRKPREVFTKAAVAQAEATGRAFPAAIQNFAKAIRDETFQLGAQRSTEAIKAPAIKGAKGKAVRTSFRFLNAMDSFFRTLNAQGELAYHATNEGIKRGLKRKELRQFVRDQIANPSDEFLKRANKVADEYLFQSELGPISGKAQNLLNTKEWKPAKVLIPFFKTPVNITKFGAQRGPLGVFSPRNIKDFIKGNPEERALAVSRWAIGTAMSSFATWYALSGNVTGDWPKERGERERWKREGIQPFAFKSGDKWVSYRRMAPFDSMFVTAASIADGWHKRGEVPNEQIIGEIALAATKKQLDTPYLQGVSDLLAVMLDDDDYKIERLASSQVTGNIPNIIGAVARAKDPVFRAPTGVVERVQATIPGLREKLPPRVDIFGRIQRKEGDTFAERFLNPFSTTTEKQSPADKTLAFYDFKPTSLFGQRRGGIKIPNDIYSKHLIEGGKRFEKVATDVSFNTDLLTLFATNAQLGLLKQKDFDPTSKLGGRKILKGIVGALGDEHGNNALREYLPQAPKHIQLKFIKEQMKDLGLKGKFNRLFELRSENLLTDEMISHLRKDKDENFQTALNELLKKEIPSIPRIVGF